jgi:transposase
MEIRTIGIDLGKTVFHLVGVNARGEVVVRKKCSRLQLLRFTSYLPACLIGMEACAGSHFLGRALREQGHDVRLMPAQYVKPYVKTNKNDYIDAEACGEAVTRPNMRFVPIKTDDQLDLQSLHRVRERWVRGRTAVINQIRGLLLERGITVGKGRRHIEEALPGIVEDADNKLSGALCVLLGELRGEMQYLHRQIEESDKLIVRIAGELEDCQRLVEIPGVGPTIATATIAAVGNGSAFKKGRGFAAWVGLAPGEHSTGGKHNPTETSWRGNKYLRKLYVQGAHAVLQSRSKQDPVLSAWLERLAARKRVQVTAVALANKMARMAWAVLAKGEAYRPPLAIQAAAA